MFDVLLIFAVIFLLVRYVRSSQHPDKFPPGPRAPLPILGDAYVLGQDLVEAFKGLRQKYGDIFGFWMGPRRAVAICTFDDMQELLNKPETANRQYVEIVRECIA